MPENEPDYQSDKASEKNEGDHLFDVRIFNKLKNDFRDKMLELQKYTFSAQVKNAEKVIQNHQQCEASSGTCHEREKRDAGIGVMIGTASLLVGIANTIWLGRNTAKLEKLDNELQELEIYVEMQVKSFDELTQQVMKIEYRLSMVELNMITNERVNHVRWEAHKLVSEAIYGLSLLATQNKLDSSIFVPSDVRSAFEAIFGQNYFDGQLYLEDQGALIQLATGHIYQLYPAMLKALVSVCLPIMQTNRLFTVFAVEAMGQFTDDKRFFTKPRLPEKLWFQLGLQD